MGFGARSALQYYAKRGAYGGFQKLAKTAVIGGAHAAYKYMSGSGTSKKRGVKRRPFKRRTRGYKRRRRPTRGRRVYKRRKMTIPHAARGQPYAKYLQRYHGIAAASAENQSVSFGAYALNLFTHYDMDMFLKFEPNVQSKRYVGYGQIELQLSNLATNDVTVQLYKCIPKRDLYFSKNQADILIEGDVNIENGGVAKWFKPGWEPYWNPELKEWFYIRKIKRMTLSPGAILDWTEKIVKNKIVSGEIISVPNVAGPVYIKDYGAIRGWTIHYMMTVLGTPIHNVLNAQMIHSASRVGLVVKKTYVSRNVGDSVESVIYDQIDTVPGNGALFTANDTAGQAVFMNPETRTIQNVINAEFA